jgi:small subunit ribosomal protein S17
MAEKKPKNEKADEVEETPKVDQAEPESAEAVADETPAAEAVSDETPAAEAVADEPAVEEPVSEEAPAATEPAVEAEPAAEEAAAEAEPVADEPEAAAEEPAAEVEPEPEAPAAAPAEPKRKRKRLPRTERHKHSKPARERSAARKPITRTPPEESVPGRRQERRGVVVSDKGDKSIVVKVEMIRAHVKYKKVVRRSSRLHAHDEENAAGVGDVVRIVETRPISKLKRWRLAEIVVKAK